ncbi:unnamed protein product [Mesocestoides corti]|uniref:Vacuolar ATPase assembly protein VMA22 n=1 Tax=Mesocestoides corti TaxID=53468 RepID=A0A0R3U4C5_MESCO|nr:unnamed protein product [Mesocestoides corti]
MDEVCSTDDVINTVMLEHLANISAVIEILHHLENSLRSGRIALAKTRCNSSSGSAKISQISYNSADMSNHGATTRVHVNGSCNFDLIDELTPLGNSACAGDSAKSSTDQKPSDPINWFCGVLVPPLLRQAQTCFRRSLGLVVELATRRAALLDSTERLTKLIDRRRRMVAETPLISLTDESLGVS